jgi:hypothetical protein
MREFNVAGNCSKGKHYMVDTGEKLNKIKNMVDRGNYFTINRGRQYGKTTTLYLLREMLKHEYLCLKISFEGSGEVMFSSEKDFCESFLCLLDSAQNEISETEMTKWQDKSVTDFMKLNTHISALCKDRKVVLLVDEVDKSSNNQIFLHFLGVLRNKYLARNAGDGHTFHSVILAGVNDIKNIKQKMITSGTHTPNSGEGIYNSPWNIATDFDVDMSFSPDEIITMLSDYESEHTTNMNMTDIAQEIYDYTDGYPFLVTRLCKIIDEKLDNGWTVMGVQEAVKILSGEKNTLFDDLFKNLDNIPELNDFVYDVLIGGNKHAFNIHDSIISLGDMYGFFKKSGVHVAIANKIFEIVLTERYVSKDLRTRGRLSKAFEEDVVDNGKFDMETCLQKFSQHYYEIFNEFDSDFLERHGRLLFLSFLKPLINGVGFYYIEVETRNSRRMDIVLDYNKEQFIIELKIWHGEEYKKKAYAQLLDYMKSKNINTGYLLTFDFRKEANKEIGAEWVDFDDGKRIFDVVV